MKYVGETLKDIDNLIELAEQGQWEILRGYLNGWKYRMEWRRDNNEIS